MSELVFFLHQVQTIWDDGMIFKPVLPDGKHHLDHVLDSLINLRLMEDVPKTLEDGIDATWGDLSEFEAALFQKGYGYFHTVISGTLQQQSQHLQTQNFMSHILIDEMSHKLGGCEALLLVVSPVALTEVEDEPLQDEFSDLRELGVDDGDNSSVDVCEDRRGALCLKNRPR